MPTYAKIAISSVAVLLLAGCGYTAPTTNSNTTTPNTTSNPATVIDTAGQVAVTLKEYAITPFAVTMSKGQATSITVKNEGTIAHSYVSTEIGLDIQVPAGQTKTASFTPTQAGTFEVHCAQPGHQDLGMHGTITVQ